MIGGFFMLVVPKTNGCKRRVFGTIIRYSPRLNIFFYINVRLNGDLAERNENFICVTKNNL